MPQAPTASGHHKTDALCRINDTFLYDDRDVIRCNLIRSFDRLCAFAAKHLPEAPFLDGAQRISLRDTILREVFLNLLIHREVSNSYPATFTIYRDTMVAENWNVPYHSAYVQLSDLTPHPKNPTIARFFANMGFVEELGVGRRTLLKYGPAYFDGREPVISEENVFSITIPYKPTVVINGSKDERLNERLNERLTPSLQSTMDIINANLGIQRKEIVSKSGRGDATIGRHLAILVKMGRIEHRDSKKTGGYYPKL